MIIYLWSLTGAGIIFALSVNLIHFTQIKDFYDSIGDVRKYGSFGLGILIMIVDFVIDSAKYIIIAIVISIISIIFYASAILKPKRWKSQIMLIIGIGFIWIAGNPPTELLKYLAKDTNSIVLVTVFIIGHLYVLTSAFQLIRGVNNENYFIDIAEELRAAREKLQTINHILGKVLEEKLSESEFKRFSRDLEGSDGKLFVGICQRLAIEAGTKEKSKIKDIVDKVQRKWNSFKYKYSLVTN